MRSPDRLPEPEECMEGPSTQCDVVSTHPEPPSFEGGVPIEEPLMRNAKTNVDIMEVENGWILDIKLQHSVLHRTTVKRFVFNVLEDMLSELRVLLADPEDDD